MIIRAKDGERITTVDDWKRLAPPKAGYHWKEGRSAFELASAWCGSGEPSMPAQLRELLESSDSTRAFEPDTASPEDLVAFDKYGGPSNCDLTLIGSSAAGKTAIVIEAKADEPFGETVGDALRSALERGVENPRSNGVRRIDELARALFGARQPSQPGIADLRYQLLTAAAAALALADKHGAATAVLVIHEFVTDQTSDISHKRNADDFLRFLGRISGTALDDVTTGRLLGPFQIPGGTMFSGGRSLLVAKITTNRRQRDVQRAIRQNVGAQFERYVGIDYSGAEVATAGLKGLRVYASTRESEPIEVAPPPGAKKYWSRKGVAHWLVDLLSKGPPAIVGIDHGFCFPLAYFEKYGIPPGWDAFLDDFCAHWPTDDDHVYVNFVRDGACGNGAARLGNTRWRRVGEVRSKTAKSLFHFDVQGSAAKSTHSGLPWLRYVRRNATRPVHFWPFDGWSIPDGTSAVVEVYPRLWNRDYEKADRTDDQHDAWVIAEWMRRADSDGRLREALLGPSEPADRRAAEIEGWILGVGG